MMLEILKANSLFVYYTFTEISSILFAKVPIKHLNNKSGFPKKTDWFYLEFL